MSLADLANELCPVETAINVGACPCESRPKTTVGETQSEASQADDLVSWIAAGDGPSLSDLVAEFEGSGEGATAEIVAGADDSLSSLAAEMGVGALDSPVGGAEIDVGAPSWWFGGLSEKPWRTGGAPNPDYFGGVTRQYAAFLHAWARGDQEKARAYAKAVAAKDDKQQDYVAFWMQKSQDASANANAVASELQKRQAEASALAADMAALKASCKTAANAGKPNVRGADASMEIGAWEFDDPIEFIKTHSIQWLGQPWSNNADAPPQPHGFYSGYQGFRYIGYAQHLYEWLRREDARMSTWLSKVKEADKPQEAAVQAWKNIAAMHDKKAAALGLQVIAQAAKNKALKSEIAQLKIKCGQIKIKGADDDMGVGVAPSPPALAEQIASLGSDLKEGDKGPLVGVWQSFLISAGFGTALGQPVLVDSAFGPITEAATKAYQASVGVPQTGVVDAATRASLLPQPPPGATTTTIETPAGPVTVPILPGVPSPSAVPYIEPSVPAKKVSDAVRKGLAQAFRNAQVVAPAPTGISSGVGVAAGVAIAAVAVGLTVAVLKLGTGQKGTSK